VCLIPSYSFVQTAHIPLVLLDLAPELFVVLLHLAEFFIDLSLSLVAPHPVVVQELLVPEGGLLILF
jgi:hypothetical protein